MPARLLREGINDSDAVNLLTAPEEVFYRRLMSAVDDFGRFDARPTVLRSRLYPLKPDIREADISRWLHACVAAGLIAVYESGGKQYILFHKLGVPRALTSKYPAPSPELENTRADENGCAQVLSDAPYSYSGTNSYSGSGSSAGAIPKNGRFPKKSKPQTKAVVDAALEKHGKRKEKML